MVCISCVLTIKRTKATGLNNKRVLIDEDCEEEEKRVLFVSMALDSLLLNTSAARACRRHCQQMGAPFKRSDVGSNSTFGSTEMK